MSDMPMADSHERLARRINELTAEIQQAHELILCVIAGSVETASGGYHLHENVVKRCIEWRRTATSDSQTPPTEGSVAKSRYELINDAAFAVTQSWSFDESGDCVVPQDVMQELHNAYSEMLPVPTDNRALGDGDE
ncbi:MAG: hypothetical protein AAGI88_24405 [Pseudomonadota bacterium]